METADHLREAATATAEWRAAQDALAAAKEKRDKAIQRTHDAGSTQTDIVKATDLTRETIRRITNPDAANAVREAQRAARKEKTT